MRKLQNFIGVTVVLMVFSACFLSVESDAQAVEQAMKNKMTFTAEIVKVRDIYVLRPEKPAEIFTVLNPNPKILDTLINNGKTVRMEVQFVSGDNVNITKINGQKYNAVEP